MSRLIKVVGLVLGVVVLLLATVLIGVSLLFDPNDYKDQITTAVADATGRDFTLEGDLSLSVFPRLAIGLGAAPAEGQRTTLSAGLGNSYGWLGGQVERSWHDDRLAGFVGLGYIPGVDAGDPSGAAGAVGLRMYTKPATSRAFAELGVSAIALQGSDGLAGVESRTLYGPALQGGYRLTTRGGFSLLLSGGFGVALGPSDAIGGSSIQPVLGLGLGYAWR